MKNKRKYLFFKAVLRKCRRAHSQHAQYKSIQLGRIDIRFPLFFDIYGSLKRHLETYFERTTKPVLNFSFEFFKTIKTPQSLDSLFNNQGAIYN